MMSPYTDRYMHGQASLAMYPQQAQQAQSRRRRIDLWEGPTISDAPFNSPDGKRVFEYKGLPQLKTKLPQAFRRVAGEALQTEPFVTFSVSGQKEKLLACCSERYLLRRSRRFDLGIEVAPKIIPLIA